MNINNARFVIFLCLGMILYHHTWYLLIYWSAMFCSMEVLNRSDAFIKQMQHPKYNLIFIAYLVFVVVDRTRKFRFDTSIEYAINCGMHIAFGLLVCFKVKQYLGIVKFQYSQKLLYIFLIFNTLGIFNEFMQNAVSGRSLLVLIADAQKDIAMNIIGSLCFIGIEFFILQKNNSR